MTIACHPIEIMSAARRHVVAAALASSVAGTKSWAAGRRTPCDFDVRPLMEGGIQGPKGVRTGRWKG